MRNSATSSVGRRNASRQFDRPSAGWNFNRSYGVHSRRIIDEISSYQRVTIVCVRLRGGVRPSGVSAKVQRSDGKTGWQKRHQVESDADRFYHPPTLPNALLDRYLNIHGTLICSFRVSTAFDGSIL